MTTETIADLEATQKKEFVSPLDYFMKNYCSLCPRYAKTEEGCNLKHGRGLDRMMLCITLLELKQSKGY